MYLSAAPSTLQGSSAPPTESQLLFTRQSDRMSSNWTRVNIENYRLNIGIILKYLKEKYKGYSDEVFNVQVRGRHLVPQPPGVSQAHR